MNPVGTATIRASTTTITKPWADPASLLGSGSFCDPAKHRTEANGRAIDPAIKNAMTTVMDIIYTLGA